MIEKIEKSLMNTLTNLWDNHGEIIKFLLVILLVYTIIYTIIFFICMYKLSKKEKLPTYKYVTPGLNWWYYFKLCNIPPWVIFIPVANIIAHIASPIKLAYEYRYSNKFAYSTLFLPFISLPIIAFGPNKSRRIKRERNTIKTLEQIDKMEEKLETIKQDDYDNLDMNEYKKIEEEIELNAIDKKINNIEENAIKDTYEDVLYGDDLNEKIKAKIEVPTDNIIDMDIEEIEANNEMLDLSKKEESKFNIKDTEENIENKGKMEIVDNAEYKDYEFLKKDNATIAFGGQKVVDKKAENVTKEKYGRNRCPRCNAAIDETMKTCPSCGNNLEAI